MKEKVSTKDRRGRRSRYRGREGKRERERERERGFRNVYIRTATTNTSAVYLHLLATEDEPKNMKR